MDRTVTSFWGGQEFLEIFNSVFAQQTEILLDDDTEIPAVRIVEDSTEQPYIEDDKREEQAADDWLESQFRGTFDDHVFCTLTRPYNMSRVKAKAQSHTSSYTRVVLEEVQKNKYVNRIPNWLAKTCIKKGFMCSETPKPIPANLEPEIKSNVIVEDAEIYSDSEHEEHPDDNPDHQLLDEMFGDLDISEYDEDHGDNEDKEEKKN